MAAERHASSVKSAAPACRLATEADLDPLRMLMALSIDRLQQGFITAGQIAASHGVMGLDTQLVADRTYFVAEVGASLAGCGGWSRRATLFGGDHSAGVRDATLLDPSRDAARVRAMYTHPDHARRGIGRFILAQCEAGAAAAGFERVELMATLAGEPLYRACGYVETGRINARSADIDVPLIRMEKRVTTRGSERVICDPAPASGPAH